MWNNLMGNPSHPLQDLLPPNKRSRALRGKLRPYQVQRVNTERFKNLCFVSRCLFDFK